MRDAVVVLLLVTSLAAAVTAWLSTAYGLLFRPPRWRSVVALFVPPLGAYWAFREAMRVRGLAMTIGLVVYGAMLFLARR